MLTNDHRVACKPYQLILLSCLMLFVELTLIRWVSSNVYNLFFFSNFILLASFLGIGIGFLRSSISVNWFRFSPIILASTILFCYMNSYQYNVTLDPVTDNLDYWGVYFKENLYPVWISLPIIFFIVTFLMAAIASQVAKLFQQFSPLTAYRYEVLGSLLGVLTFSLLSLLHMGPMIWGMVILTLYTPLLRDELTKKCYVMLAVQTTMLMMMMAIFTIETTNIKHYWSSYYKIEVQEYAGKRYAVNVNGLPQQIIESVKQRLQVKPFYLEPYKQMGSQSALNNVLVIGSGTGGDVALALSQGAKHVDAVEIDPVLYQLGVKFNPDRPYQDPRVEITIDDGRAFLQRSEKKYDLIIFALTDSLALVPGQSSIRLENYLYTFEGMKAAKEHLVKGGVFTIYNYYRLDWIVNRLANTLAQVYQHAPCIKTYSPKDYWATVLTISNGNTLKCATTWKSSHQAYETPATDNHPFVYLQLNTIPTLYIASLLWMLLGSLALLKFAGVSYHSVNKNLHLFLMGTAFLLLETKNVIGFSLLFGTTWFVSALVFMGVLMAVYASIEITHHYRFKHRSLLYLALLLSLTVAWRIPNEWLLSLPAVIRFFAATSLAFTPIVLANILFADQFRQSIHSAEAFGANLLGAVLGGMLEYSSLVIGYQNLFLLIASIYLTVILLINKKVIIRPLQLLLN